MKVGGGTGVTDILILCQGVSLTAMQTALARFDDGVGGRHDGIALDIEDLMANRTKRPGITGGTVAPILDSQQIGLRIDKRRATGAWAAYLASQPKLVSEKFETGVSNWVDGQGAVNAVLSHEGSFARVSQNGGNYSSFSIPFVTTIGTYYRVLGDYLASSTGNGHIIKSDSPTDYGINREDMISNAASAVIGGELYFKATAALSHIHIVGPPTAGQHADYDNIEVVEADGNHMVAAADDERGTYDIDGDGVAWNTLDGVNDGYSLSPLNWSEPMRLYLGIKTTDNTAVIFKSEAAAGEFFGYFNSGSGSDNHLAAGTIINHIDAIIPVDAQADTAQAIIADGEPHLWSWEGFDPAAFDDLELSKFAAQILDAGVGSFLAIPESVVTVSPQADIDFSNAILSQMKQPLIGDPVYNIFDASKVATAAVGSFNLLDDLSSIRTARLDVPMTVSADAAPPIGSSIGIIFDKSLIGSASFSLWLSSTTEIIDDGDFDAGIDGWVGGLHAGEATALHIDGKIEIENITGAAFPSITKGFATVVGEVYRLGGEFIPVAPDSGWIIVSTTQATYGSTGRLFDGVAVGAERAMYIKATSTTTWVHLLAGGNLGDKARYDNLSLKHIPGIHWSAEADDERPTLQQTDAEVRYLLGDGVNDSPLATAPISSFVDAVTAHRFDSNGDALLGNDADNSYHLLRNGGNLNTNDGVNGIAGPEDPLGTDNIVATRHDATRGFICKDRSELVANAMNGPVANSTRRLMSRGATEERWLDGRLYGWAMFNRKLHGVELYNVEQALEDKMAPPAHKLFYDGAGGIREGGMFDSADLTSMFIERVRVSSSMTNPAVSDNVGTWLDKKHMGDLTAAAFITAQPELNTDINFADIGEWTDDVGWSFNGQGQAVHTGSADYLRIGTPVVGDFYQLELTVDEADGSNYCQVYIGNSPASTIVNAPGSYKLIMEAVSGSLQFALRGTADVKISRFSIKHIPGDHVFAAADDERPTLTVDGVTPDGVNDAMGWAANPFSSSSAVTALARFKLAVYPPVNPANGPIYADFGNEATAVLYHPHGNENWYSNFGTVDRENVSIASSGLGDGQFHTSEEHVTDDDFWRLFIDGVQPSSDQACTKNMTGTPKLFGRGGQFWSGTLKRLMFIDYDLEGYELLAATKWEEENG